MKASTLYLKKSTITREHLAKVMKRRTGININKASVIVDQIIDMLIKTITAQKEIKIRLFGSFSTKYKAPRIGRNPKTMVETEIPARLVVRFKVAPTLKKRINDNIQYI